MRITIVVLALLLAETAWAKPPLSGFGDPLGGITGADLDDFDDAQDDFHEVKTLNPAGAASGPSGQLGPLFNNTSCASCHSNPARGGGGLAIPEMRLSTGGPPVRIFAVDHMLSQGPLTQGSQGTIFPFGVVAPPLGAEIDIADNSASACQLVEYLRGFSPTLPICVPGSRNDTGLSGKPTCIAQRQSLPLFGDGLVEATDDSTFEAIAAAQPDAVRGTVRMVSDIDNFDGPAAELADATRTALSTPHVARFGWKADFATLLGFSGDAYFNEMGITNDLNSLPNTTCAMGVTQFGVQLQSADDPEDPVDETGKADIDRFTIFMRDLAPPPELPLSASAQSGQTLFNQMACQSCHTPQITTSASPALPPSANGTPVSSGVLRALTRVSYRPYSDFLLHDMGSLGDGINDDPALTHDERLMRTMPLFGIRARSVFLHDGRATDLPTAIALHDGQGAAAAAAFKALSVAQQQNVVDFLQTR
jgi:CxxC motif-containing protein (DUF1111 family)